MLTNIYYWYTLIESLIKGGFIELASDKDRLEEYRRIAAFNRKCGVEVHEITPHEVKQLFPLCAIDDILAGTITTK